MKKILVTGSSGLVGNAIKAVASQYPYDFIFVSRNDCNLIDGKEVHNLIGDHKPNYVLHMAAKVGGVLANIQEPAIYFYENIMMNTNIIHSAHLHNVEKLLACSSICACPDLKEITEDVLQEGTPFKDHMYYGYSKRMVDIQIQAYRKQFGVNFGTIIPGNMFGEHDNFNLMHGHVLPSLIHKCYLAKKNNTPLTLWGDGTQRREFTYSQDVARIMLELLELDDLLPLRLLISSDIDYSTREIADIIIKAMDFPGKIVFDTSMPIGQQERHCNTSYMRSLFPNFKRSDMAEAITQTVNWFVDNYPNIRQ